MNKKLANTAYIFLLNLGFWGLPNQAAAQNMPKPATTVTTPAVKTTVTTPSVPVAVGKATTTVTAPSAKTTAVLPSAKTTVTAPSVASKTTVTTPSVASKATVTTPSAKTTVVVPSAKTTATLPSTKTTVTTPSTVVNTPIANAKPPVALQEDQHIDATYKIRVGSFAKPLAAEVFKNLEDLGMLSIESVEVKDDQFLRVSLGTYMGKNTAKRVLEIVKKRGYKDAYFAQENSTFEGVMGEPLTHTFQFSASKQLDVTNYRTQMNQALVPDKSIYIYYEQGYYNYSLGIFAEDALNQIDSYQKFAKTTLASPSAYPRAFRQTPISTNPTPLKR
jgi:SPOR domain